MTTPLTPSATALPSTVSIPANGESLTEASVTAYVQPILNAIEFMGTRTPGANRSGALLDLLYPPSESYGPGEANNDWSFASLAVALRRVVQQTSAVLTVTHARIPLDSRLVNGMVIRAMALDFCGSGTHALLPLTMPVLSLIKSARSVGVAAATLFVSGPTQTTIDSVTDASANAGAYDTVHTISKTLGTPETVDLSAFTYELQVTGEFSTNAQLGSVYLDARISVSA